MKLYNSYNFTDIDNIKFKAVFRGAWSIKQIRRGYKNYCKKLNKQFLIREYLSNLGIVSKVKIINKKE